MSKNTFITDIGVLVFPKLITADAHFVKKATDKAKFKTGIELPKANMEKLKEAVKAWAATEKFEAKKPAMPWKFLTDKEGNDTEREIVSASRSWRPLIVDAGNKRIPDATLDNGDFRIGGGTKARVSVEYFNYGKGVSLRLQAVQITELVKGGDDSPFGAEEGGYSFGEEKDEGSPFGGSSEPDSTDGPDI